MWDWHTLDYVEGFVSSSRDRQVGYEFYNSTVREFDSHRSPMKNQDIADVLLSAAFYKDTEQGEVVCKICAIALPMVPARIRRHLLYHIEQGYAYNTQTNEMELHA